MDRHEVLSWLRERDELRLERLWASADLARRERVGDAVHLRGLVEISNHCVRRCAYCGLRAPNEKVERYRMTTEEIAACVQLAVTLGYGTILLQSGEDPQITKTWMAELIRRIKDETPLAVTLSLGERRVGELEAWRAAGADRYLLRFETSNPALFERIHPPRRAGAPDRLVLLSALRQLGYEVGSGVMVGLPGQTYEDLATDLELFRDLDLDMIGVGPYLPHPDTPLGQVPRPAGNDQQVPNSELMTYKVVALTRLLCPRANIPTTTALVTLNRERGRELGLMRGANVVMPNLTPAPYRRHYEIYPAKACLYETVEQCHAGLTRRIRALGRTIGTGRGDSLNWRVRPDAAAPRNHDV
jgi:biotin synthase